MRNCSRVIKFIGPFDELLLCGFCVEGEILNRSEGRNQDDMIVDKYDKTLIINTVSKLRSLV